MRAEAQRTPHQPQTSQTNLKLPLGHPRSLPARDKMKFNWRANWEILLVFVIIIVGIVITTIAAIRSKDKHLLVAPDETADYGGNIVELTSSLQVPPLPQTDFQLQNGFAVDGSGSQGLEESPKRPSKPSSLSPQQAINRNDRKRSQPASSSEMARPPANVAEAIVASKSTGPSHRHHSTAASSQNSHMTSGSQRQPMGDNYEAMSTEETPSQVLRSNSEGEKASDSPGGLQSSPKLSENRRDARQRATHQIPKSINAADQTDDVNDQSEAQYDNNAHKGRPTSNHYAGMQGPYELSTLQQLQAGPRHNIAKLARQQEAKLEQIPTPPPPTTITDSEDMMTSYTRVPQIQPNHNETLLRGDYSASSSVNSFVNKNNTLLVSTGEEEPLGGPDFSGQLAAQSGQTLVNSSPHQRAYANLPFVMLLNDMMKLSRPQPMIDSQATLEQPANPVRPQFSILQQLRSLPSPLLALFQQPSSASQGGEHLQSHHPLSNHDTSESNDHYHRISMTPYGDLNALVARSLRSTNPLPAFPPPKGVPQAWVPSNMGGVSVLQEAASSNADFVASETAGFVRGATIAGNGASGGMQVAASNVKEEQARSESNNGGPNVSPTNAQSNEASKQDQRQQPTLNQQAPNQMFPTNQNGLNGNAPPQPTSTFNPSVAQQAPQVAQNVPMQSQAPGEMSQPNAHMPSSQPALTAYNNIPVQQSNHMQYIMQNRPLQRADNPVALRPANSGQLASMGIQSQVGPPTMAGTAAGRPPGMVVGALNLKQGQLKTTDMGQRTLAGGQAQNKQAIQLNAISRVRRSTNEDKMPTDDTSESTPPRRDSKLQHATRSGNHEEEDEEDGDYLDSAPISIVRPDGRPMSDVAPITRVQSGRNRATVLAQASSQRQVNHADLNESALHHYVSHHVPSDDSDGPVTSQESRAKEAHRRKQLPANRLRASGEDSAAAIAGARKTKKGAHSLGSHNSKLKSISKQMRLNSAMEKQKTKRKHKKQLAALQLDAASSGLMSKLLGVASTNDELEDDLDGDDDESANERRKEELEDAEFGIVNDDRSNGPSSASDGTSSNDIGDGGQDNNDVSRLTQDVPSSNQEGRQAEMPPIRSAGTTDSNAYARRNQQQQRSDVEFYGHPGEETRQLKYGILGSGNYEVVNGGIYPDIDESTAAVNSVANYVRKPGAVLLAGLPHLLGSTDEARKAGISLTGGGFMRGASAASPGGAIGLYPAPAFTKMAGLTNPLLDVLDAAHMTSDGGQAGFFDPSLVPHLGSSGTSTRTTHASRDQASSNDDDDDDQHHGGSNSIGEDDNNAKSTKRPPKPKYKHQPAKSVKEDEAGQTMEDRPKSNRAGNKNEMMTTMETHNDANNRIKSSSDVPSTQGRKMNQFYSYHIMPHHKKTTIFSDQDLDSAPDDRTSHATYALPDKIHLVAQALRVQ